MAGVFEMLEREWSQLCRSRAAARQLDDVCRIAGDARSLADVEAFVRHADPAATDHVLLALVTRAIAGESLAARVLLQLLLPGTRSLARRWWALGDPDERAAAAIMAVYHRIRSYPLARRPGRVAANILMDAARELRHAVRGAAFTSPSGAPVHEPATDTGPHPAVELAEVLVEAVHHRVIDAADAELIARSRIGGDRVADIAALRGSRPRTLWDRRQRAEQALVIAYVDAAVAS
ncbi:MAG: hypothetical protein ACRD2C_25215 [Acidimicrobiales bacterium]